MTEEDSNGSKKIDLNEFTPGMLLPIVHVVAKNFAEDSDNKMHSDATAAEYGFRGGLVPGVGVYAYMTQPIVSALGRDWLERGTMWGKFLKPVYHGETVTVEAEVKEVDPLLIETRVINSEGTLCGIGEAGYSDEAAPDLQDAKYCDHPLPDEDDRIAPDSFLLPAGTVMGSLDYDVDFGDLRGESGELIIDEMVDPLPIYRGDDAAMHPAICPTKGNRILASNVALGPWIHTETRARHLGIARDGECLKVRGVVHEAFEKRGHHFAVLDVGIFGDEDRPLAHILHTSIIKPARAERGTTP